MRLIQFKIFSHQLKFLTDTQARKVNFNQTQKGKKNEWKNLTLNHSLENKAFAFLLHFKSKLSCSIPATNRTPDKTKKKSQIWITTKVHRNILKTWMPQQTKRQISIIATSKVHIPKEITHHLISPNRLHPPPIYLQRIPGRSQSNPLQNLRKDEWDQIETLKQRILKRNADPDHTKSADGS